MEHTKAFKVVDVVEDHFRQKEQIELIISSIEKTVYHLNSHPQLVTIDRQVKDDLGAASVNLARVNRFLNDLKEPLFIDS